MKKQWKQCPQWLPFLQRDTSLISFGSQFGNLFHFESKKHFFILAQRLLPLCRGAVLDLSIYMYATSNLLLVECCNSQLQFVYDPHQSPLYWVQGGCIHPRKKLIDPRSLGRMFVNQLLVEYYNSPLLFAYDPPQCFLYWVQGGCIRSENNWMVLGLLGIMFVNLLLVEYYNSPLQFLCDPLHFPLYSVQGGCNHPRSNWFILDLYKYEYILK